MIGGLRGMALREIESDQTCNKEESSTMPNFSVLLLVLCLLDQAEKKKAS